LSSTNVGLRAGLDTVEKRTLSFYFSCNDLRESELSQIKTPEYFVNVVSNVYWMQNGACDLGCPVMMVA
jgi:hypothetical protein